MTKKSGTFQFKVDYMKYKMLKIGHIKNRLSRCFNMNFKKNIENYQISVAEKIRISSLIDYVSS